jgi:hypothetical protein
MLAPIACSEEGTQAYCCTGKNSKGFVACQIWSNTKTCGNGYQVSVCCSD